MNNLNKKIVEEIVFKKEKSFSPVKKTELEKNVCFCRRGSTHGCFYPRTFSLYTFFITLPETF